MLWWDCGHRVRWDRDSCSHVPDTEKAFIASGSPEPMVLSPGDFGGLIRRPM